MPVFGPSDATIDFTLVASQLIQEAFDICQIGSEGEAITADMYARGLRSLNLLAKALSASDHLWLRTERSVTLVAGTASYVLDPKPSRVLEVRRRVTASSIDTPMMEWSREQYTAMPNKTTQSIPTAFYYDPQKTTGTLYVWPCPSTATASTMTLELTYLRKIQDFDASADAADFPQEWLLALAYMLAEQLALKYGVAADVRQEITARAAQYKSLMEAWDTEPASLFLSPDYRQ